mgnify:CR=1 FL=1
MSYLCIKKQEPTAGAKGIMCGGVFLPIESYESEPPTPASQIPSEGLTLYVPLSEAPNASEWAGYGSITYKTVDGVPCAYFNGDNSNGLYMGGKAFETQTFTVSIVFNTKSFSPTSGYMPYLVNFGTSSSDNSRLALRLDNYYSNIRNALAMVYNGVYLLVQNLSADTWYSAQMKFDGRQISLYLNGELKSQFNVSAMEIQSGVWIGKSPSNDGAFNGYLSSLRVYNRALSDAEIALLAREFVFNPAPLAGRKGLLVPVGESVAAPPANGMVFYAPLSEESSTAETGQALTKNGTITYETLAGIPCITKGNTSAYLSAPLSVEGVFTLSFWIKTTYTGEYIGMAYVGGLCIFDASSNSSFQFSAKKNSSERINFQGISKPLKWRDGAWHHIAMSITSTESKLYCDGTLISTASGVNISTSSNAYIGWDNDGDNAAASYSRFRIYNRILSASEIQSLAFEHNPTKSLFIPLQTAYGTPQAGQKGIIVRSSQVVGHATYSKSAEAMPTEGLVFYLPCDSDSYTTAETGQTLSKSGTVTATTVNGIPCLEIKSGSYLNGTLDGFSGDVSMALSFWFKRLDSNSSAYVTAGKGNYSLTNGNEIWGSVESDHIETACGSAGSDARRAGIYNAAIGTGWHHGYFSYDATSKKFKTVLDGNTENAAYSAERSYNFSSGLTLCINSLARATSAVKGNADYSQIRIFNRALSDAEIKLLAGEYKPEEVKKMFIAVKGTEITDIPSDGLIFHAPFNGNTTPNVGAMVLVGNKGDIAYNTQDGITYAVLPGTFGWRIYAQGTTDLTVGNEYSYICYYRDDSNHSKARRFLMNMNLGPRYQNTYVPNSVNKLNVCDRTIDSSSGKWHFICIRSNGSVASIKGFLDASTWTSGAPGNNPSRTDSFLAAPSDWATSSQGQFWHGGIFDFAVYSRILTDEEVENLYQRIFWLQA